MTHQEAFYPERDQALAAGATYYKGRPCRECSCNLRWTQTDGCMHCHNAPPNMFRHTRRFNPGLGEKPRAVAPPYLMTEPIEPLVSQAPLVAESYKPKRPPGGFLPKGERNFLPKIEHRPEAEGPRMDFSEDNYNSVHD